MKLESSYAARQKGDYALTWPLLALVGFWVFWPILATGEIGTADSPPISLNTMAQPDATHLVGILIDSHSKLPIGETTVNLSGGSYSGTATTDQYGKFAFPNIEYAAGPFALFVDHVSGGYNYLAESTTLIEGGTSNVTLELQSRTVILLHGMADNSSVWEQSLDGTSSFTFKSWLEANDSYHVINLPFYQNCASIADNAKLLMSHIALVHLSGIKSYSIVAHSAGGLITRQYLAAYPGDKGESAKQIDKFIMLGTPNHGSDLAKGGNLVKKLLWNLCVGPTDILPQLIPGSPFLNSLNYGERDHGGEKDACQDHDDTERLYGLPASSVYQIAGTYALDYPCNFLSPYVCGIFDRTASDGVVAWTSARLYSTPSANFWFDSELGAHTQHLEGNRAMTRSSKIVEAVEAILDGSPPGHAAKNAKRTVIEEPISLQFQPELAGTVNSVIAFTDSVFVAATSLVNFLAVWEADSLAFDIRTPAGILISPAYADTSLHVEFLAGAQGAQFSITEPENGWWRVMLSSAAAEPESLWVLTALDSPLALSADVTPVVDTFGEIICSALFLDGGLPLPNATVGATVTDPGGAITTMQLFDNGTHGDQAPHDGEFFNSYAVGGMTGAYSFMFTATRDTTVLQSEARVCREVAFASQMAEIAIGPAGLVVANPLPSLGSLVTISSTFHNVGAADADSVSILLRNVSTGTVLADTTVFIAAGQEISFQAPWLAVVPDTTRFRITATLGGGAYEADYLNNSAPSWAVVYMIDGVSGVGGLGEGDDGDPFADPRYLNKENWLKIGPNPFNPSVEISFSVPKDNCPVSIDIFDVAGRRVRHLVGDVFDRGHHRVQWEGRDESGRYVASGVYFCRLDAGGVTTVRKMMTVK